MNGGIFRDEGKLHPEYVPRQLVDREEEFRELVRLFKPFLQKGTSQRVLIHGAAGSGKTALSRRFAQELESFSDRKNIDLNQVYIDCRTWRTKPNIAWKIANANKVSVPRRGVSTVEYLEALKKHMEEHDYRLLVVFDWIDFHVLEEGSDLLYSLTRMWENSGKPNRVSLIGVSRDPNLSDFMDKATSSTLLHNRVLLNRYTTSEVREILQKRADLAFKPGAVEEQALDLIADNAQWQDGAGLAIEWLLHAGIIAVEKNDEKVRPEHALESKSRIHAQTPAELLATLNRDELLLLLAFAEETKNKQKSQIRTGKLWEKYKQICTRHGENPKGFTRFSKFVDELSNLQLIKTEVTGGGSKGNTREITVPGASPLVMETVLERFLKKEKYCTHRT